MKVKIISTDFIGNWYSNKIGETFDVNIIPISYNNPSIYYSVINGNGKWIPLYDAEPLKETHITTNKIILQKKIKNINLRRN